jgi:hypothetical protein
VLVELFNVVPNRLDVLREGDDLLAYEWSERSEIVVDDLWKSAPTPRPLIVYLSSRWLTRWKNWFALSGSRPR